jgi:DNA-binding MarR family transcriptional regulator
MTALAGKRMTADRDIKAGLNRLIDEVYRLNGRLIAAAKMTTQIAGLRPPHWVLLTAVARAAEPPTVARIGRSLGQTRQGVQRVADDLFARGLVDWIDNPEHRRARRLVLSDAGRKAEALANQEGGDWLQRVGAGLDAARVLEAIAVLQEFRHRLEADARGR